MQSWLRYIFTQKQVKIAKSFKIDFISNHPILLADEILVAKPSLIYKTENLFYPRDEWVYMTTHNVIVDRSETFGSIVDWLQIKAFGGELSLGLNPSGGGIVQVVSTVLALATAIILWRQIIKWHSVFKGTILFNALNSYIAIQRDRSKAVTKKDPELAENYYREMFDLHWTEFQLWRKGYIDDNIMKAWLHARRRNYEQDAVVLTGKSEGEIRVSYKGVWNVLTENAYFVEGDPFLNFMYDVHHNKIEQAIKNKKKYKEKY